MQTGMALCDILSGLNLRDAMPRFDSILLQKGGKTCCYRFFFCVINSIELYLALGEISAALD